MASFEIDGVAVVTGGASGIGAACCRVLAARGARVVVLDRAEEPARAVANEVKGVAWVGDVGDEVAIEAAAAAIEAAAGPVEVLVNSAGVIQVPLPPEELAMSAWDDVVRIDQRGTYVASIAFGRRMALRGRGAIVNIASIAGMRSMPLHSYAPAKAAVIAMTKCLAAEWGRSGVRVNAVSPGYTRTPALQAAIDKGERDVTNLEQNAALGRMVEPDDIARAVAFLASREAAAITGVNLPVDCGWLVAPSWHTYGGVRPSRS
ncbi:MAG: SDR family oxidoreductase [Xanthobacteraceae bacterium]|nr:SDR family oxidoreductase [Xanthobacteraceae bacterium]PWB58952.1 MAG: short-chain dehydrogenase [Bradyrhizobiaceae bacterium]